jgi:hypothetical protein
MSMLVLRVCGWMRVMNTGRPPSSRRTTGRVTVPPCGILTVSQLQRNKVHGQQDVKRKLSRWKPQQEKKIRASLTPWFVELGGHVGSALHLHPACCVCLEEIEHVKVLLQELLQGERESIACVLGSEERGSCRVVLVTRQTSAEARVQGTASVCVVLQQAGGARTDLLVLYAFELGLQLLLHQRPCLVLAASQHLQIACLGFPAGTDSKPQGEK